MRLKAYKAYCFTAAGLSLYLITLPFFSFLLNKISPLLTVCAYNRLTGKPCPFCGGTRYILSVYENGLTSEAMKSPFFVLVLSIAVLLLSRIALLPQLRTKPASKLLFVADVVFHSALAGYIISYVVGFFA